MIVPAMSGGFIGGKRHSIKVITEIIKKNSEAAKNAVLALKIEDIKETMEFLIARARRYLAENPNFKGSRNDIVVQIKADIDKIPTNVRERTNSESTITNYLKKYDLA
jgi:indole-3-glycerol phosphate synthase